MYAKILHFVLQYVRHRSDCRCLWRITLLMRSPLRTKALPQIIISLTASSKSRKKQEVSHTYSHTHALTHEHTHTLTNSDTHSRTRSHMHSHMLTCTHTHAHTCTHTCAHIYTQTRCVKIQIGSSKKCWGHQWYSGNALDCLSRGRAIDSAPGA